MDITFDNTPITAAATGRTDVASSVFAIVAELIGFGAGRRDAAASGRNATAAALSSSIERLFGELQQAVDHYTSDNAERHRKYAEIVDMIRDKLVSGDDVSEDLIDQGIKIFAESESDAAKFLEKSRSSWARIASGIEHLPPDLRQKVLSVSESMIESAAIDAEKLRDLRWELMALQAGRTEPDPDEPALTSKNVKAWFAAAE